MKRITTLLLCFCMAFCGLLQGFGETGEEIVGYWAMERVEGNEEAIAGLTALMNQLKQLGGSLGFEFNEDGSGMEVIKYQGQDYPVVAFTYVCEDGNVTLSSDELPHALAMRLEGDRLIAEESDVTMTLVRTFVASHAEPMLIAPENYPVATITMQGGGEIVLELYPDKAPNTVANFIELANSGFYDGVVFHRVISGFMIQGGDPLGNGTGGPGYTILGEFSSNGFAYNDLSHERGVISMARASAPDSAGSQFFIMHADGKYLDGNYAAFGRVLSGMEVVDAIAGAETNQSDRPLTDQVIESIRVDTKGITYSAIKAGG